MDGSKRIDKEIADLADWRGDFLAAVRRIVHEAVPDVVEEWKWMDTSCWSRDGRICTCDAHVCRDLSRFEDLRPRCPRVV